MTMVLLWMALSGLAAAQDGALAGVESPALDAQLWRMPADATATLWADDTTASPLGHVWVRQSLSWMKDPLRYQYTFEDGTSRVVSLVESAFLSNTIVGVGLGPVRVALDLPLVLGARSGLPGDDGGGLGDVAVDAKGTVLHREEAPVGLALTGRLGLPTATVATALGSSGVSGELAAVVDQRVGPVLLVGNLGSRFNPPSDLENVALDDQLVWRLGAGYFLAEEAGLSLDFAGRSAYGARGNDAASPGEALLGGFGRVARAWAVRGGVGAGLNDAIGAPALRVIAAAGWEPPRVKDMDSDGILDKVDACKEAPEDADGWQDTDGCPDPSTRLAVTVVGKDGDFIQGAKVLLQAPDGERKGGTDFSVDVHPGEFPLIATADGYRTIEQSVLVPAQPKHSLTLTLDELTGTVRLSVQEPGGEPISGRWAADRGEAVAFTGGAASFLLPVGLHSLEVTADGYRPRTTSVEVAADQTVGVAVTLLLERARVTREKIEILDKVYFETAKAVIRPESFPLLDQVAAILTERPDITKVQVEGHTDTRGPDARNLALSQARADSVRAYLLSKGVAPERLVAVGFGETRPVEKAETPAAWDQNRRVEFVILARVEDPPAQP